MFKVILSLDFETPITLVERARKVGADIAIASFVLGTKWYGISDDATVALDELKLHKIDSPACEHAYTSRMKVGEVKQMFEEAAEKFTIVEQEAPQ